MNYSRREIADLAISWVGKNEMDGSYKYIVDIYNSYKGKLPRGTKMRYDWPWCACTWSALAINLGYTDIMPIEISCYYLIEEAKKMGIWVEEDNYFPNIGDGIIYDWKDNSYGENKDGADHIGVVVSRTPESRQFLVVEGNKDNKVGFRTVDVNGRYIRGFICPRYEDKTNKSIDALAVEVIAGLWGNGNTRKYKLKNAGYEYDAVQKRVNELLGY